MNVYDFDGTIYSGDSTVDFWKYSLKRHPLAVLALFPFMLGLGLYLFGIIDKTKFKQRFYQFFKYIPDIEKEVYAFWTKHEYKLQSWYLLKKDSNDIIISASPEFLLKPMCDKLAVHLIASRVDKNTGIYTGENCYGAEKLQRLREEFPNIQIDFFYSDSQSDNPLAEISKNPFWVNGDRIIPWQEYKINMVKKIKATFFSPNFFLFVICGGCGTLVNLFFSLIFSQSINPVLAYVGGYTISLFVTYILNTYLIFKQPFSLVRLMKFAISYIPNFLILFSFVAILLNIFHLQEFFVYLSAAVFGLPLTFVIVKIFTFGNKIKGEKQNG